MKQPIKFKACKAKHLQESIKQIKAKWLPVENIVIDLLPVEIALADNS